MKCKKCGGEFEGNFCPHCGLPAKETERPAQKCPVCGATRKDGTPYCAECGYKFAEPPQKRMPAPFPEYGEQQGQQTVPPQREQPRETRQAVSPQREQPREQQRAQEQQPTPHAAPVQPTAAQAEPAYAQTVSPQTMSAPAPAARPQKTPLVLPIVGLWVPMSVLLIELFAFFYVFYLLFARLPRPFGSQISTLIFAILLSAAVAVFIPMLFYRKGKWGTRAYKTYVKGMRRQKKTFDDLVVNPFQYIRGEAVLKFYLPLYLFFAAIMIVLLIAVNNSVSAVIGVVTMLLAGGGGLLYLFLWKRKYGKEINLAYYGKEKPTKTDRPIVTYGQVAEALHSYQTAWDNYILYKARYRSYERDAVFTAGSASRILFVRIYLLRILAFLLSAALIVSLAVYTVNDLWNVFQPERARYVQVGMSYSEVHELFGEPYEYDPETETYRYYSEPYRGLLEESAQFDPDDIQDMNDFGSALLEAAALAEQMSNTEYSYVEIVCGEGAVISFFFDSSRTETATGIGEWGETRTVLSAEIEQGAETGTAVVTTEYSDGSLWKARVEGTLTNGTAETVGDTVTLSCYDPYMQQNFTVQATVVEPSEPLS